MLEVLIAAAAPVVVKFPIEQVEKYREKKG